MSAADSARVVRVVFLCGLIFLAPPAARAEGKNPGDAVTGESAAETLRAYRDAQEKFRATQLALDRYQKEADASAQRARESASTRLESVEQSLDSQNGTSSQSNLLVTLTNLQEKIHAIEVAFDRYLAEADSSAARASQSLTSRLDGIEQALNAQRAQQNDAANKSNHLVLTLTGVVGVVGLLAFLAAAWLNWRTANRLTEAVAASSRFSIGTLGFGHAPAALEAGNLPERVSTDSSLLGTISRLEKRIRELEDAAHILPPDESAESNTNGHSPETKPAAPESATAMRTRLLLGKGQSLLHLNKIQEAIACFDEALAIEPANAEALVKKGTALERQQKLKEALECYDHAIEVDDSLTIAYLQKGGVFNRLELYTKAQECYEQALRTQERRPAANV